MNQSPPKLEADPSRSFEAAPAAEADLASRAGGSSPPAAESPFKSTGGSKRVYRALRYSMRGLVSAWRIESAFRQELTLASILIPAALLLPIPIMEMLALIASVLMVLIVELINSSIEAAVDRISLDHHRLSGRAKDLGSAAVFLAVLLCFLAWTLIAGPVLIHGLVGLRTAQ